MTELDKVRIEQEVLKAMARTLKETDVRQIFADASIAIRKIFEDV